MTEVFRKNMGVGGLCIEFRKVDDSIKITHEGENIEIIFRGVTEFGLPRLVFKGPKSFSITNSWYQKATAQSECICGEINARNCPVHQLSVERVPKPTPPLKDNR